MLEMAEMDFDFRDQIQTTDWYPLEIHYKNNALFMVSTKLSLAEVAKAVAQDEKSSIEKWIEDGLIFRPPEDLVEDQRKDQYKVFANFIIVAPYVFIQSIRSE
tara:strand:- start:13441 stop:13749 length:309 start_codon:yes stop_codon:yes gene_type:complete